MSDDYAYGFWGGGDKLLIGLLLFVSVALSVYSLFEEEFSAGGWKINVIGGSAPPVLIKTPPEAELEVPGLLGKTVLEWSPDGLIRVTSSPCPLKICVNRGWAAGPESLYCIPNGVIVEFLDSAKTLDGVSR